MTRSENREIVKECEADLKMVEHHIMSLHKKEGHDLGYLWDLLQSCEVKVKSMSWYTNSTKKQLLSRIDKKRKDLERAQSHYGVKKDGNRPKPSEVNPPTREIEPTIWERLFS